MTAVREPTIVVREMAGWQSNAAFVIQFRESTDITAGRLDGKVEHIASYQSTRFHSLDELLAFMGRVLSEIAAGEPPAPPKNAS